MYLPTRTWDHSRSLLFTTVFFLPFTWAVSVPGPVAVDPSQRWEGNDGLWSTFNLRVGTPAQNTRVLIGLAGQESWVVSPNGCTTSDPSSCPDLRGGTFNHNASSSWISTTTIWNNTGFYELGGQIGNNLGVSAAGEYGFDTVGLGWDARGPSVNRSIVASIVTKNYYLGQLGISPRATNFTTENGNSSALIDPQPSFLTLLKQQKHIPSLSWGFNPGSYYRSQSYQNAFGSLTLGGYDTSKGLPDPLVVDFAPDDGRELVVGVQAVKILTDSASTNLLQDPILAALDSTQPYMWLPLATCQLFESAFGLVWNDTTQIYTVNSTTSKINLAANPTIQFTLGSAISGGRSIDIELPYASFNLSTSVPDLFPLKRGKNSTQWTLGRHFLQEVYLVADYERHNFSIYRSLWGANSSKLITIKSPLDPSGESMSSGNPSSITSGAKIAGIIIAVIIPLILAALCTFWTIKHRQRKQLRTQADEQEANEEKRKSELPLLGTGTQEMDATASQILQLDAIEQAKQPPELHGIALPIPELDGPGAKTHLEMDGESGVVEIGEGSVYELPTHRD